MISFNITEDYLGAEVRAIKEIINLIYGVPRSIYDDVDTLKNQMLEVLGRLDNLSTDFIPEKAENLNQCVGRVIFGYGNNCINKPTGSNGYLINIPHDGRGDLFNKQLWLTRPQNQVFVRNMDNGTFRVHTDGRIELLFSTGTIATDSYHFITTNFLAD